VPQPHLPAPLAPRPEPGAQLLEAVRLRQARPTLQLTQQWVHRRGVLHLQHFCDTELSRALGPEALTWLQDLLALDTPIHPGAAASSPVTAASDASAPSSSATTEADASLPVAQAVGQADPEGLAETFSNTEAAWSSDAAEPPAPSLVIAEAPPIEHPSLAQEELQARAVAAVDEAFAALAQTFHHDDVQATSTPVPPAFPAEPAPAVSEAPAPLPVRSSLWPSLRASAASLGSAFRPLNSARQGSPLPDLQSSPSPSLLEDGLSSGACGDAAGMSPAPLPVEGTVTAAAPLANPLDRPGEPAAHPDAATDELSEPTAIATTSATEGPTAATTQVGLLGRLRTVMRDCVEETVALLRTPEQQRNADEGGFDVSQPQEPTPPIAEPPAFSWNLDSFPAASPAPGSGTAPLADAVPAPAPEAETPASAPSLPTLVSRLRFGLPISKPRVDDDQPAPSPAGLSDLQAWLPDRGDLPRAS